MPLPFSFALIVLGYFVKNKIWRKRLVFLGTTLIIIFSNPFIANIAMKAWEGTPTPFVQLKPHDIGVVLTGITNRYKQPGDRVYTERGADRVLHTIQMYKKGIIKEIIISGGSGKLMDNATDLKEADELMKIFLLAEIPDSVITIENESRNTTESAVNVSKLISAKYSQESALLISSAFHIRRATACFVHEGINITPFGTDYYAYDRSSNFDDFIIPKASAIKNWEVIIREVLGIITYWLLGYI